MSFHSVHNVGVLGIIEVHESSCFCETCFLNEPGNCKNAWLVERFAWTSVYKKQQVKDDVQNKLWDSYSLPYRHKKALFFRPKATRQKPKQKDINHKPNDRKQKKKTLAFQDSIIVSPKNQNDFLIFTIHLSGHQYHCVIYYHFIFLFYLLVHFILYKAPSLI